jgi:ribonuclease P/MRP protein subunit POP1
MSRFPPKMAKVDPPVARQGFPSLDTPSVPFPTSVVAQSLLWDEGTREGLAKPKFTKRDLDSRRAENLIPGTALKATSQDARVPVILIQHSIESSSSSSSLSAKTPGIHGWTLLVPNGWGMPFLSSLLFTGARVGGLRERAVQAFESGIPSFPADAVDSDAYADEVERSAEEQQTRWMRTPPAKRINYEERGINDPWRPDWRGLLGLDPIAEEDEEEFVAAQREPLSTMTGQIDDGMDVDPRVALQNVDQSLYPWVLRGPDASAIISAVNARLHPSSELLSQLDHLRQKRGLGQLGVPESDLWRSALVHVRYEMCGRGRPTEGAMAFVVKDDEAKAWIRVHASRSSFSMDGLETVDETQVSIH